MITEALRHCQGIGPVRLSKLHAMGVRSWHDVLEQAHSIPVNWRDALVTESLRCLAALESRDIPYFVEHLAPQDRWRILSYFLNDVSFFDIETAGLEYDDPITVVVCWHQGELRTFVEHENLDDFLLLLDDVTLLTSFNGGSFDVPRVLSTFHIPELPCAHLDLRWVCYHQGLRGGLKEISARQGVVRPADLRDADGELAVQLWERWQHRKDQAARDALIRYCAADVLLLVVLSQQLAGHEVLSPDELWTQLPAASSVPVDARRQDANMPPEPGAFGAGSPGRIRARRRRLVG